jgi:hypothetical protein
MEIIIINFEGEEVRLLLAVIAAGNALLDLKMNVLPCCRDFSVIIVISPLTSILYILYRKYEGERSLGVLHK